MTKSSRSATVARDSAKRGAHTLARASFLTVKRKPTPEELIAAKDRTIPDLVRSGLDILMVGINPSLYSAALGLHFARPGNRFWPTMAGAGFVPAGTTAFEQELLLATGVGITNIVDRATVAADELSHDELAAGARALTDKVRRLRPRVLAFLGVSAYRNGFGRKRAAVGEQAETIDDTKIWVLPNPSGLNANYQLPALIALFSELRRRAKGEPCLDSSKSRPA